LGSIDQGTCQGYSLLLASAQFRRTTIGEVGHFHHLESTVNASGDFGCGCASYAQSVGNIFADGEVRKECVILKDGIDTTPVGRKQIQTRAVHPNLAGTGLLESCNNSEQSRFARSTFAEES
jgi:hypothetical protein